MQMAQSSGNVTVRMAMKTQKKLDQLSGKLDRSRNWLINEAVENYLDVFDWQEQRIKARLRKAEKGGKFLAGGRVDKIVDSFRT